MNLFLVFLILSMVVNIILVFDSKQLFKKLQAEQEKNKGLLHQIRLKECRIKYYEDMNRKIKEVLYCK